MAEIFEDQVWVPQCKSQVRARHIKNIDNDIVSYGFVGDINQHSVSIKLFKSWITRSQAKPVQP